MSSAAIAQALWPTVTIDNVAQVAMPLKPVYTSERAVFTDRRSDHVTHSYVVSNYRNGSYFVQTGLYPESAGPIDAAAAKRTLTDYLDFNGRRFEAAWNSMQWKTFYDATAVEVFGMTRKGRAVRMFALLADRRYISLHYFGPPGTEKSDPEVDLFFASLLPASKNYWQPCSVNVTCILP